MNSNQLELILSEELYGAEVHSPENNKLRPEDGAIHDWY